MNSPFKTLPENTVNGLRPSDIKRYEQLTGPDKRKARERLIRSLKNLRIGRTETSILPNNLVMNIWCNEISNIYECHKLFIWEAYDGGTHFRLELII